MKNPITGYVPRRAYGKYSDHQKEVSVTKAITLPQIEEIAASLECDPVALRAVLQVETAGPGKGFVGVYVKQNGAVDMLEHPVVLFERHVFARETDRRYFRRHPDLCHPTPGGYARGASRQIRQEMEVRRLYKAIELDRTAALRSASWGLPQIMGFNYELCECNSVEEFVERMKINELEQVKLFAAFLRQRDLVGLLRTQSWEQFAEAYNGPAYRKNDYHGKLRRAYEQIKKDQGDANRQMD